MALAQHTPIKGPRGKECHVAYVLRIADDDDAGTLLTWLADDVDADWIGDRVRDEYGFRLNAQSIRRHRRGGCMCGES
jgi:hypothetical protein